MLLTQLSAKDVMQFLKRICIARARVAIDERREESGPRGYHGHAAMSARGKEVSR